MLEYFSAFEDLVVEVAEPPAEPPASPEDILECVPEEPPEAVMENAEDNPGRVPSTVVHGPYYYFYQGESFPVLLATNNLGFFIIV